MSATWEILSVLMLPICAIIIAVTIPMTVSLIAVQCSLVISHHAQVTAVMSMELATLFVLMIRLVRCNVIELGLYAGINALEDHSQTFIQMPTLSLAGAGS